MHYFFMRLAMVVLCAIPLQANTLAKSAELFTPKRCAGLVLCAGGACFQSGLKSYLLIGAGLVLVTDNVGLVKKKAQELNQDVIKPAKISVLARLEKEEKHNPNAKDSTTHKVLRQLARVN